MKQVISKELEAIKESKRSLAEIFCKLLKTIEPDDVITGLGTDGDKTINAYFIKNEKRYYISIDLKL